MAIGKAVFFLALVVAFVLVAVGITLSFIAELKLYGIVGFSIVFSAFMVIALIVRLGV